MTNESLQVFYDLLTEAFEAGMQYQDSPHGPTAGDTLFALAARMEEIMAKMIGTEVQIAQLLEREACAEIAFRHGENKSQYNGLRHALVCNEIVRQIRNRGNMDSPLDHVGQAYGDDSLPSSPERKT